MGSTVKDGTGAQWFAIYNTATGALVSHESDDATLRLTDQELADAGLARKPVATQLKPDKTWDPVQRKQV